MFDGQTSLSAERCEEVFGGTYCYYKIAQIKPYEGVIIAL